MPALVASALSIHALVAVTSRRRRAPRRSRCRRAGSVHQKPSLIAQPASGVGIDAHVQARRWLRAASRLCMASSAARQAAPVSSWAAASTRSASACASSGANAAAIGSAAAAVISVVSALVSVGPAQPRQVWAKAVGGRRCPVAAALEHDDRQLVEVAPHGGGRHAARGCDRADGLGAKAGALPLRKRRGRKDGAAAVRPLRGDGNDAAEHEVCGNHQPGKGEVDKALTTHKLLR